MADNLRRMTSRLSFEIPFDERRVSAGDLSAALMFSGSHHRASLLADWNERGLLDDDAVVRSLIEEHWSSTEAWSADTRLRETMYGLLRRSAPIRVLGEPERPLPAGTLTVYRGNLGERPCGGSWTLDRATAEHFASMAMSPRGMFLGMYREDGVPSIWRATCDSEDVLGYFDDRGEREVVVEPGALDDVELVTVA